MNTRATLRTLAAAYALVLGLQVGSSLASPVGTLYLLSGTNFPGTFDSAGPLTFNAEGDISAEVVPGAGLTVFEIFAGGVGPHGGDLLFFVFDLIPSETNVSQPFGFVIRHIDLGGGVWGVASAGLGIDFGLGQRPLTGTLSSAIDQGFDLTFVSHLSWADLFRATNPPEGTDPTKIIVSLFVEVQQVPEPSTLLLLGLGLIVLITGGYTARSSRGVDSAISGCATGGRADHAVSKGRCYGPP